jgi:hypothetical protein
VLYPQTFTFKPPPSSLFTFDGNTQVAVEVWVVGPHARNPAGRTGAKASVIHAWTLSFRVIDGGRVARRTRSGQWTRPDDGGARGLQLRRLDNGRLERQMIKIASGASRGWTV